MKFTINIDENIQENELIINASEYDEQIRNIENFISNLDNEIYGYKDKYTIKLCLNDIFCFTIEDNHVVAILEKEKYFVKKRIYTIEENLNESFLKINQSTIVNIKRIKRFNASFSGTLMVELENGYKDFVSRRQLKKVKEIIGRSIWST